MYYGMLALSLLFGYFWAVETAAGVGMFGHGWEQTFLNRLLFPLSPILIWLGVCSCRSPVTRLPFGFDRPRNEATGSFTRPIQTATAVSAGSVSAANRQPLAPSRRSTPLTTPGSTNGSSISQPKPRSPS